MSVKQWAIKAGEVKALDRAGLLLFGARVSLRVEPWVPSGALDRFRSLLEALVRAGLAGEVLEAGLMPERRKLRDQGALACNRLAASDEPVGRAHNYATSVLATVLEGADAPARNDTRKHVLEAAKYAGSIAAIWGHAGRVVEVAGTGLNPVDFACEQTWAALREDLALIVLHREALAAALDPLADLKALAPLWPLPAPSWSGPSAR